MMSTLMPKPRRSQINTKKVKNLLHFLLKQIKDGEIHLEWIKVRGNAQFV